MNIAFIGLGNMGGKMAHNLLKAGLKVYGYDLSEVAIQHFAEAGGVVCSSPQDAAKQADMVITMLPAAKHVKEVYLGENGVLEVLKAGSLCIDSSTIDPQTIKDIAAVAHSKNIKICDAPVSGGTIGAQAGTLTFMVGADEQTFNEVKPVLSHMGKNIVHIGEAGAGQITKACNQMIVGMTIQAVSEAFTLANQAGVDLEKMREVLLGGFAQSRILDLHGQRIIDRNFKPKIFHPCDDEITSFFVLIG